jgi:hypothetical protein
MDAYSPIGKRSARLGFESAALWLRKGGVNG